MGARSSSTKNSGVGTCTGMGTCTRQYVRHCDMCHSTIIIGTVTLVFIVTVKIKSTLGKVPFMDGDVATVAFLDIRRGYMSNHKWFANGHSNCGIHGYLHRGGGRQGVHP